MWTELDQIATTTFAKEKAKKEGFAEGKAKGKAEGKAEVAQNLLAMGMSVADISKATGLSEEEIQALTK